jgi:ribonuclease E
VLLIAPAAADDLAGDARKLLATGMKPDAAALQLMQQGAYPEDAAAALFEAAPALQAVRQVAFAVVRAGAAADPQGAVALAAGVAGLSQPAPVPVAAAVALAAPDQAAAATRVLAEAAPQAAPLIVSAMIRLSPASASDVAVAAARAVPSQALFTTSAALQTAPDADSEAIIAAVSKASGQPEPTFRDMDYVARAIGANAMREAQEVLADLPLPSSR